MADIARAAAVSRTTVSLVLNNRYIKGVNISDETRRKVKSVALELGYCQNELATSVAKGKSRIIGCIGFDVAEEVAISVCQLISATVRYATERDYSIKLLSSRSSVTELAHTCQAYRMCGVLLRTRDLAKAEELHEKLLPAGIPVILLDSAFDTPPLPSVVADDRDGMRQAVEYLASLGHRRLTYIAFEDFQPFTRRRRQGFLDAVEASAGNLKGCLCNTDNHQPVDVFERSETAVCDLLHSSARPTAFVCNCDESAMVTLRAAWRCGLRVPDDLSVVGFGNLPTDQLSAPPLTSVAPPYVHMCESAIDLLLSGDTAPREIIMPVSIKIRRSAAPPAMAEEADGAVKQKPSRRKHGDPRR